MRRIVLACARRPVSVLMAALAVLVFGSAAFFELDVELLPELRVPLVRVVTEFPGVTAEEVEQLVTVPLENALSSVKGLKAMESVSKEGVSCTTLRFDWKADLRNVAVEVREKIDSAFPYLPYGIEKPAVSTEDLASVPIITLAAFPKEGKTISDISPLVRKDLASRLARIPGVASAKVAGTREREILVEAGRGGLSAAGITVSDLASRISAAVFDLPVGIMKEGDREYLVKAVTGVESIGALAGIPLSAGGGALTVGDLAEVRMTAARPSSFFLLDGRKAIGVFIFKIPKAGSIDAAKAVLAELPSVRETFAREFDIQVVADGTEEIASSFDGLLLSLCLGAAATFGVLYFTFRNLKASIAVSAAIPLCLASVFLFLKFAKISLNVVSLTGIAVGIGMIVDNSIVVVENVLKRGARNAEETAEAASEPASSIFASTATTVLVFLPVLFIPGMLGGLFSGLALTVSVLLAASFFLAFTLTPALCVLLLARPVRAELMRAKRGSLARRAYERYLLYSFRRPWTAFAVFGGAILAGAVSFGGLEKRIVPRRDPGGMEVLAVFPPGTRIEATCSECEKLSRGLLELACIKRVFVEGGYDGRSPLGGRNPWTARFTLILRDGVETCVPLVSAVFASAANCRFTPSLPEDSIGRLLGAGEGSRFRLEGNDREEIVERAESIAARLRSAGLVVSSSRDTGRELPRLRFVSDDGALAQAGLSPRDVFDALEASVRGKTAARLPYGDEDLEIRVRLKDEETADEAGLARIAAVSAGGRAEVGVLGRFETGYSYPELHRSARKTAVELRLVPAPGKTKLLEEALAAAPEGRLLSAEGLEEGRRNAGYVFLAAGLLMYLVLGAQFESFLVPLLLLISFPLSTAGSFLLLRAYGYGLNLNSVLGTLILLGTTINSTILLTGSYGKGGAARIVRASLSRLSPLGATVNTTIIALLPMLALTEGANALQSNTAAALAGGLSFGTLSILLVYPVVYQLYSKRF